MRPILVAAIAAKTADQLKAMPEWQEGASASSTRTTGSGSSMPPPAPAAAPPKTDPQQQ